MSSGFPHSLPRVVPSRFGFLDFLEKNPRCKKIGCLQIPQVSNWFIGLRPVFFPQTAITSINSKQLGVFVVDLPKVVGTFEKESNKKLSPHGGALKKSDEFYGIESIKESHLMATNKSKLRGEFKTRKLYQKGPTETTYPFF